MQAAIGTSATHQGKLIQQCLRLVLAASALGLLNGCKGKPAEQVVSGADASTPRKCAFTLAKAMQAQDLEALRQICIAADSELATLKTLLSQSKDRPHFTDDEIYALIDRSPPKVDGDTATYGNGNQSLKLIRQGGIWKFDIKPVIAVLEEGFVARAKVDIAQVRTALEMYRAQSGEYPPNLAALVTNPGVPSWTGPYLKDVPSDPWSRPYHYVAPGARNSSSFDLTSAGPNGILGDDDDVTN